jgi:predicted HTH domain antitoxin
MNDVVSFRLSEKEIEIIENIASEENKDKSEVARELIDYGETFRAVKRYKKGKISIGKMASELDITITEAMSLLTELGINSGITQEDQVEARENLKKVW